MKKRYFGILLALVMMITIVPIVDAEYVKAEGDAPVVTTQEVVVTTETPVVTTTEETVVTTTETPVVTTQETVVTTTEETVVTTQETVITTTEETVVTTTEEVVTTTTEEEVTTTEEETTTEEGLDLHRHSLTKVARKQATLVANGNKLYFKCTCGKLFLDAQGTKETTKEAVTYYHPKTMTLIKSKYVYDGKQKTPILTIKDTKGNVISSKNYTVTKSNGRTEVGEYLYKIVFKENYTGTKTLKFSIVPGKTAIKTIKRGTKSFDLSWAKKTTQVTGYQIQYSTSAAFDKNTCIVTINKNWATSATVKGLKSGKKYYVRIRTYKTVGTKKIASAWSDKKAVTTK